MLVSHTTVVQVHNATLHQLEGTLRANDTSASERERYVVGIKIQVASTTRNKRQNILSAQIKDCASRLGATLHGRGKMMMDVPHVRQQFHFLRTLKVSRNFVVHCSDFKKSESPNQANHHVNEEHVSSLTTHYAFKARCARACAQRSFR